MVCLASHGAAGDADEEVGPPAKEKVQDHPLEREYVQTKLVSKDFHQVRSFREGTLSGFHSVWYVGFTVRDVICVHVMNRV